MHSGTRGAVEKGPGSWREAPFFSLPYSSCLLGLQERPVEIGPKLHLQPGLLERSVLYPS